MSSGGGGTPKEQTVTSTTVNIPPELMPYVTQNIGRAQALTDINANPYQQYSGQRLADFSPMQLQAFQSAGQMQPSSQLGQATGLAGLAGMTAADLIGSYSPMSVGNLYNAPQYQGMGFNYQSVNAPNLQQYQMSGPQNVGIGPLNYFQMQGPGDITGAGQGLTSYQMTGPGDVGTSRFIDENFAQQYMSPYMQAVVEAQQRDALRQSNIAANTLGAKAATSGAFGSTRHALENAEANRNLALQLGDIQATGSQRAYEQAQQQFTSDYARRLQADMANQQMGYNTAAQNLAAQLGVQQLGSGQALQAALANQQARYNTAAQNLGANLGVQQLGTQSRLQADLANQQAAYNTALQNLQAKLGVQELGAGMDMQSQLANQASQLQMQQMQQAQNQFMNQYAQQNAQLAAQYGLSGLQLQEQSRQFGAGLDLDALQAQLAASGQLGQLGSESFQQQMGIMEAQRLAGEQQQQLMQQQLALDYQDWLDYMNYPYQQLGFMSDLLRGAPLAGGTSTVYGPTGSSAGQAASLLGGLGSLYMGTTSNTSTSR